MAGDLINIGDSNIPAMWNIDKLGIKAVKAISESNIKAGVTRNFSSLPIKCCGKENCIYGASCFTEKVGLNTEDFIGQVCPIEVELILTLFDNYTQEFGLTNLEDKKNTTVIGLLKDLIDTELQIERSNKRLMIDGEYLEDRIIGVSEKTGETFSNKEINQHILFKEKMQERKEKILGLLNATPKDKANEVKNTFSPDQYAADIIKKAQELNLIVNQNEVKDVEFETTEDVENNESV